MDRRAGTFAPGCWPWRRATVCRLLIHRHKQTVRWNTKSKLLLSITSSLLPNGLRALRITRSIKVLRIEDAGQLKQCRVIFFSKSAGDNLTGILSSLSAAPILTLADNPGAISQGIAINMNLVNEKIVFEINLGIARKHGLDISSKLLQLATKVHQ